MSDLLTAKLNARVINKHGTEEDWSKATNFIPKEGEILVYEADENHSSPYLKVGNGTNNVTELPYVSNKNLEANDIFEADGPILKPLGGISVGDDLDDKSIKYVLKKLLYPYVAPEIKNFTATADHEPAVYEKGTEVHITKFSGGIVKKSCTVTKVSLVYNDGTEWKGSPNDVVNEPTEEFSISHNKTITSDMQFAVYLNDTQYPDDTYGSTNVTKSDTISYKFVYPYYYGVIAKDQTIDDDNIKTLIENNTLKKDISVKGQHTYTYQTNNTCPVIAYPKSYGELKSITDPNNFTQGWTLNTVFVNSVDYYVYVGDASTATAKYTFKY